ncbi:hypothetical protein Mucpa_3478 [Mucilaginibacter paludis DSM 18603]|uniref:Glycosyl transferase family 2 n=2 Tax=Mucilaginibacter TaxID=423349 RepID=H1YIG3_9SPHI|nr:hypothetical protein Mucpa_3478 [Mucilaginibacter paludis DSM 18603]
MKKKFKISICIVSMNRLHHLKQTLLQNIIDNSDYQMLEYILLDYNSNDGMEKWVKENFQKYISDGILKYYRTVEPTQWNPSHAKNLAFNLAQGEILCNIWADYYAGPQFATYVNEQFNEDENIVLTPIKSQRESLLCAAKPDVLAKVCVRTADFKAVNGFDEKMDRHGFEDHDFVNRLELIGVKRTLIEDLSFLNFISHSDDERFEENADDLKVYINYKSPFESEILFLYNNGDYKKASIIDNYAAVSGRFVSSYIPNKSLFEYTVRTPGWQFGVWNEQNDIIRLSGSRGFFARLVKTRINGHYGFQSKKGSIFYIIDDQQLLKELLTFDHFFYTRSIMEENMRKKVVVVNSEGYGQVRKFEICTK